MSLVAANLRNNSSPISRVRRLITYSEECQGMPYDNADSRTPCSLLFCLRWILSARCALWRPSPACFVSDASETKIRPGASTPFSLVYMVIAVVIKTRALCANAAAGVTLLLRLRLTSQSSHKCLLELHAGKDSAPNFNLLVPREERTLVWKNRDNFFALNLAKQSFQIHKILNLSLIYVEISVVEKMFAYRKVLTGIDYRIFYLACSTKGFNQRDQLLLKSGVLMSWIPT